MIVSPARPAHGCALNRRKWSAQSPREGHRSAQYLLQVQAEIASRAAARATAYRISKDLGIDRKSVEKYATEDLDSLE
jgi:hypothetical protein